MRRKRNKMGARVRVEPRRGAFSAGIAALAAALAIALVMGYAAVLQAAPAARAGVPAASARAAKHAAHHEQAKAPAAREIHAGPAPAPTVAGQIKASGIQLPGDQAVISFLAEVIAWYHHLPTEERLVTQPAETIYVADDREMAQQIGKLSFEFARAQAALLAKAEPNGEAAENAAKQPANANGLPRGAQLNQIREQADAQVKQSEARIAQLQASLKKVRRAARGGLEAQLAAAQGDLQLGRARVGAIEAMQQFETSNAKSSGARGQLGDQIDELQRSVPDLVPNAKPAIAHAQAPAARNAGGIVGLAEELMALRRKRNTLNEIITQTGQLAGAMETLRRPLIQALRQVNRSSAALTAQAASGNLATVRESGRRFDALLTEHKLAVAALLPLSKAQVIAGLYGQNLKRWRSAVAQQSTLTLHRLALRVGVLAGLIIVILIGALVWRQLTFRYVQDHMRRHQILQARRWAVAALIVLVLLFNFASELGSLATVLGFAAAGIALALQNVILSIAGYFFLIGRFGIKIGDRVQLGGVNGEVIDVGLVKLTLAELSGESNRLYSGRVVVFSNAIVFQPNGNFFKQAPGTSFVWNEFRLTVAPDCDYRLAEKRLLDAVNEVFARYRDQVQREYRAMERNLTLHVATPKPESRLRVTHDGIEMAVRYPAEARGALQIADEVTRRVLDAIKREPGLTLVAGGTSNLQAAAPAEATPAEAAPAEAAPGQAAEASDGATDDGEGHAEAARVRTAGAAVAEPSKVAAAEAAPAARAMGIKP